MKKGAQGQHKGGTGWLIGHKIAVFQRPLYHFIWGLKGEVGLVTGGSSAVAPRGLCRGGGWSFDVRSKNLDLFDVGCRMHQNSVLLNDNESQFEL